MQTILEVPKLSQATTSIIKVKKNDSFTIKNRYFQGFNIKLFGLVISEIWLFDVIFNSLARFGRKVGRLEERKIKK